MRILFNHGLTPGEIYSNTPKKVTDKKWRNLNDTYGWNATYEDAIAGPFRYCLGLILHRVIDDRVRFVIPTVAESYIDFEIVTGDKFMTQRQNGRFQEVDFVESDFTGYFMNYYFKTRAYPKMIPIYIGSELKRKFMEGVNSGVKFYTTKDVFLDDFIDEVQAEFNTFTKAEIKRLLTHGFRRMHSAIKFGCAISIISKRHINCLAYIGHLTLTPDIQIKEYSIRRDRKLRKIEGWKKTPFDGYYYIGLNPTGFNRWLEDNKTSKSIVKFNNIIPRKIKEELYYKAKHVHIFRFKRKTFKGWSYWADSLKVRDLEYMGEAYEHKFTPSNKTWQELRNEERNSK